MDIDQINKTCGIGDLTLWAFEIFFKKTTFGSIELSVLWCKEQNQNVTNGNFHYKLKNFDWNFEEDTKPVATEKKIWKVRRKTTESKFRKVWIIRILNHGSKTQFSKLVVPYE